ncbi:hypothetical protein A1O3_02919 [Capronia epimyces CBS 606.96]|uniref:Uncharacterized protein n=1 Tax=Capronia epimyces CBS 606.96 TaxID=1182542 RepID=W9YAK5_9EURO|nr:uncharacterized protein A1O3_02919 [Capronia epimyces CBS 606.96]EXJ89852.1 hypothetical protein A1O3_02919 [Capronia epimyces CBS 606.96]
MEKRPRRVSSNRLSIEELTPDDMGYDGDIEVLLPDQYEEPDSDFEDHKTLWKVWPDTDDELAGNLRRLSCHPHVPSPSSRDASEGAHKRRSRDMVADHPNPNPPGKRTVLEVSELVDTRTEQPPLKRRKKKSSKQSMAHLLMKKQATAAWSDSSDKTDEHEATILSSNSGTPETASTPVAEDDDRFNAMDMG